MAGEHLSFNQDEEIVDVGGVHVDALLPNSDGMLVKVAIDGVLGRRVDGDIEIFPGKKTQFDTFSAKELLQHFSEEDFYRFMQTMVSAASAIAREKRLERGAAKKVA